MNLTNKDIDTAMVDIEKFFETAGVSRKDRLRLLFVLEESLLRWQEHFGTTHEFKITTRKFLSTPKIIIRVRGAAFNPLEETASDDEKMGGIPASIMQNLLNYENAGTTYRYEDGLNELTAFAARELRPIKIPGGSITISILLAILASFILGRLSPEVQSVIISVLVTPILDKLLGLLIAVNIPLIFISIISSICAVENVTMLNAVGSKILVRFLAIMTFTAVLSILVGSIFFPVVNFSLQGEVFAGDSAELGKIFELILSIIPQNAVAPFLERNILQVAVWALLIGIVAVTLGSGVAEFKNLILNLRQIAFRIMRLVMKLIPLIIFLCILKMLTVSTFAQVAGAWKIVAAEWILFAVISLAALLRTSLKYGLKVADIVKKISPAFLISFTTGSGSASMPKNIEVCENVLKIDKNLCEFYIPLSHALCPIPMIIGIIICTFYAAEFDGAPISLAQIFVIAFLAVQFAISSAGGNGSMIAAMTLMLTHIGLPLDAIGPMTVTDIFVVNISGVVTVIVRDCDLIDVAHQVSFEGKTA